MCDYHPDMFRLRLTESGGWLIGSSPGTKKFEYCVQGRDQGTFASRFGLPSIYWSTAVTYLAPDDFARLILYRIVLR